MTTTLLKRHRTLLKAYLHSVGIPVRSLITPGMLSKSAAHMLVNAETEPNGGTVLAFQIALGAKLAEIGHESVSIEAIRHMLSVQPAPTDPAELARAIAKALRL